MLIFALHYSPNPADAEEPPISILMEFLISCKTDFYVLYHPLGGIGFTWLEEYRAGIQYSKTKVKSIHSPEFARYVSDVTVGTLAILWRCRKRGAYFIGADPLNAVIGLMLRALRAVEKTVYYSIDYAPERFSNPLLNWCYHYLDRLCMRKSDYVWSVSIRIVDLRRKMGLPDSRNLYLPNVPDATTVNKYLNQPKDIFRIITLGSLDDQQHYMELVDAVSKVRMEFPKATLTIVGTGRDSDNFREHVKKHHLEEFIHFTGHLGHEEAMDLISRSGVGCALYTGKLSFNYFGDSVKCREYLAFGLPVLTSDTHATALDIKTYDAGVICESTSTGYLVGIKQILREYARYAENARMLGSMYDGIRETALRQLVGEYFA